MRRAPSRCTDGGAGRVDPPSDAPTPPPLHRWQFRTRRPPLRCTGGGAERVDPPSAAPVDSHLPDTFTPEINTSKLSRVEKTALVALIAQFAPQSPLCAANPPLEAAVDDLVLKAADFSTKNQDATTKQQAFFAAVTARGTSKVAVDNALEVFKSNAKTFCKSEQDLKNLGVSRKPTKKEKGPPVPGTSSTRTLTGLVSGQQYWIRYCTERGQTRSEWSAPILVTAR